MDVSQNRRYPQPIDFHTKNEFVVFVGCFGGSVTLPESADC